MPDSLPTCVIYNPKAGRGRARKLIDAARARHAPEAELLPTEGPQHAGLLAQEAIGRGVLRVIAAGGDGTVHEVANGLLEAPDHAARLAIWPLGSMNDLAFSLGVLAWWKQPEPQPLEPMRVDVGIARAGDRSRFFVNSAGAGFNAQVTQESRKIRWLRGIPLYAYGLLRSMILHFATPPCSVAAGETMLDGPLLALSVCLAQREGGFPLGKDAILDDGAFDVVRVGKLWRYELVRYLPQLITGNLPTDHPELKRARSSTVRVRCERPIGCHTDGELLCMPEDGIHELSFDLIPRRITVEVYSPGLYGGRDRAAS